MSFRANWALLPFVLVASSLLLFSWSSANAGAVFLIIASLGVGMFHGATDIILTLHVENRAGKSLNWFGFLAAYLGLIGLVLAAWILAPVITTVLFQLVTAWHWGTGDVWHLRLNGPFHAAYGFGRGLIIIGSALGFGGAISSEVISLMMQQDVPVAWSSSIGYALLGLGLLSQAIFLPRVAPTYRRWQIGEIIAILLLFSLLPVLIAMTAYFAGIHSLRHLHRLDGLFKSDYLDIALVFLATCLPVIGFLIWLASAGWSLGVPELVMLLRLSALTLPHAVLIFCLDYHKLNLKL